MAQVDVWKLQDAKARFSEVVRRARAGEPQEVTVHGRPTVAVVDVDRFDVTPKVRGEATMAGFMERSKKYRGLADDIDFEPDASTIFRDKDTEIFDDDILRGKKR